MERIFVLAVSYDMRFDISICKFHLWEYTSIFNHYYERIHRKHHGRSGWVSGLSRHPTDNRSQLVEKYKNLKYKEKHTSFHVVSDDTFLGECENVFVWWWGVDFKEKTALFIEQGHRTNTSALPPEYDFIKKLHHASPIISLPIILNTAMADSAQQNRRAENTDHGLKNSYACKYALSENFVAWFMYL